MEINDEKNSPKTLFLDRDGVINQRIVGEYVHRPEDFVFLEGVLEAFAKLARKFDFIFIVTNQQGIGKGKMSEADLAATHQYMQTAIEQAGGRIDAIYHCPHLSNPPCDCRKPRTGMALQAQRDFPQVDFTRATLVGDFISDLQLAKSLGMYAVWVDTAADLSPEDRAKAADLADMRVNGLAAWAATL